MKWTTLIVFFPSQLLLPGISCFVPFVFCCYTFFVVIVRFSLYVSLIQVQSHWQVSHTALNASRCFRYSDHFIFLKKPLQESSNRFQGRLVVPGLSAHFSSQTRLHLWGGWLSPPLHCIPSSGAVYPLILMKQHLSVASWDRMHGK